MNNLILDRIYMLEEMVTKALSGCKRSIIELYVIEPELFKRGTPSYTVLEPYLYEANMIG